MGKFTGKLSIILMVKTPWFPGLRFSLKPIHWIWPSHHDHPIKPFFPGTEGVSSPLGSPGWNGVKRLCWSSLIRRSPGSATKTSGNVNVKLEVTGMSFLILSLRYKWMIFQDKFPWSSDHIQHIEVYKWMIFQDKFPWYFHDLLIIFNILRYKWIL